jgi:hypothetical protein
MGVWRVSNGSLVMLESVGRTGYNQRLFTCFSLPNWAKLGDYWTSNYVKELSTFVKSLPTRFNPDSPPSST